MVHKPNGEALEIQYVWADGVGPSSKRGFWLGNTDGEVDKKEI